MKAICSLLVLFLLAAVGAVAQTVSNPSETPGLIVIEKKWRIDIQNHAVDEDPFRPMNERQQEVIDQRETQRQNEARARIGLPPVMPPVRIPPPKTGPRGITTTYVYQVKIRNTGEKAISALTWEYVFFEPGTEREVGRRRFTSKVKIRPGKTGEVVMRSASPPTGSINAANANKKSREQYSEQVVIQSIEYLDGSVWRAASN